MKRAAGVVLFGLGVFLLVLAPLVRWVVAPALVRAPLDQSTFSVSEAAGATYLDRSTLTIRTGATLRAVREVRADVKAGSDDRAVWNVFVTIKTKDGALVSASTDRVAMDRRTAETRRCCREAVNGEPARHAGIEYKFPFGTQKKTNQYFDTTLRAARPMRFQGEDTVQGVDVYEFEQVVEPAVVGQLEVPGRLVGEPARPSVKADVVYSNTRTVWVEPTTGIIVRGQEHQRSALRTGTGETVVLDAAIAFTGDTVRRLAGDARDARSAARTVTTVLPLAAAVLGLVLVACGLLLLRRPRRPGARRADRQPEPEPAGLSQT